MSYFLDRFLGFRVGVANLSVLRSTRRGTVAVQRPTKHPQQNHLSMRM